MFHRQFSKSLTAGAVFTALALAGILFNSKSGQAANDNNGSQDEKRMIEIGLAVAASEGITLNMNHKDPDMVGLGSYLVNVSADCDGCHSAGPPSQFAPGGNPYLLPGANPPFFSGIKRINPATYLGGTRDFGAFPSPGGAVHIISRNLTPGKGGLPEGDHSLSDFMLIMRTGIDLDHAHPNCPVNAPNCLLSPPLPPGVPPFNGALLQVMPWPSFQSMTDRELTAIYTFLSAIPCLEGGPGEPFPRC
jgi:hypothetical protein